MAYDVFISYRRQGGGADARMMYDRLQSYGYTVSFDMDTLKNGNFNEELLKRVAECKNFVVLLSENCFERTLNGCKREDDWLRIEIATALYNNKNIVTVMLPGFVFPAKLPPDIDAIRNKNGPKYDLYYIDGFYDKLVKDFLIMGEDGANGKAVTALEEIFSAQEETTSAEGTVDVVDLIGDDTDFIRSEAEFLYAGISRLLPYVELSQIDKAWREAEEARTKGDYKAANNAYLHLMELAKSATPCASEFVMRMTADGIDTRKPEWFKSALAKAQGGNIDYQYGVGSLYAGGLGVPRDPAAAFRWFERAARNGHVAAQAAIGAAYAKGDGVEADYQEARSWLEKAAAKGYPTAEERLGWIYRNGFGVTQNIKKAIELYESASELGNPEARNALAELYEQGEGVDRDINKAVELYRSAAADDHPVAMRHLAELLFKDDAVVDKKEALAYCRRAVNAGDSESIVDLGLAYENGWGVDKDVQKAGDLYQRALSNGCESAEMRLEELKPEVQFLRGVACMEGANGERDFEKARAWFEKAAEQGHIDSIVRLASMLEKGLGCAIDIDKALELYNRAVKDGCPRAMAELGRLYREGVFVTEDLPMALNLFQRAASSQDKASDCERWGVLYALYDLASMYRDGKGVTKDELLAARLFLCAARQGNISSCRALGIMYRDGKGVQESQEKAGKWFSEMWRLTHVSLNPCDSRAMDSLGDACRYGQGVEHNLNEAAGWWRKAVQLGENAASLLNVGMQHPEIMIPGDTELAAMSIRKKAEGGNAVSMANMGIAYFNGYLGFEQDLEKGVAWFKRAAEKGHKGAMGTLALRYETGEGVAQDYVEALKWLEKAAEKEYEPAQLTLAERYFGCHQLKRDLSKVKSIVEQVLEKNPDNLGALATLAYIYRDGLGVEENAVKAHELSARRIGPMSRGAEAQNADSLYALADCYRYGRGVDRNINRAVELYEKAAEGKNEDSVYSLMRIYLYGLNGQPYYALADKWVRRYFELKTRKGGSASRGEPDACVSVGNLYRLGRGVERNSHSAIEWYEKAADKKSWQAMLYLADMYRTDEGLQVDLDRSNEWAVKAVAELTPLAENGLAKAQRGLADCYANGWGVDKSPKVAAKWYGEAYEGRDWLATGRLARLCASGEGGPQNIAKAVELLAKAAEKESAEARCRLGECYERGEWGLDADVTKAFELYRESASEGDAGGMYNLGRCYLEGIGIEKDKDTARLWLGLASAEKGDFWGYAVKADKMLSALKQ